MPYKLKEAQREYGKKWRNNPDNYERIKEHEKKRKPENVRKKNRKYRDTHREKIRESSKKWLIKLRHDAIMAYGGYECVCNHGGKKCGVLVPNFLTLDHINNDGAIHRKALGGKGNLYQWLKVKNYPPGFQVLCYNCNCSKGHYGKCPQEEFRDSST